MKIALPALGLVLGFLIGHGTPMPPDLFVLLGAIVISHAGVHAFELRHLFGRPQSVRNSIPTSSRL